MKHLAIAALAAAAVVTAGCDAKIGNDAGPAGDANGQASADGKAKEGQVAIKAPGLDLSVSIPMEVTGQGEHDGKLLYPGATPTGVYIAGGEDGNGEVEIRFRSGDTPAKVAAWYRDPARAPDFELGDAKQEGSDFVASGTQKEDGQSFRLRLAPHAQGGTDGRLVIRDRG